MDNPDWELLAKYLAGEASRHEEARLTAWIDADPTRGDLLVECCKAWTDGVDADGSSIDAAAAWMKVKDRIAEKEADAYRSNRLRFRGGSPDRLPRQGRRFGRRRTLRAAGGVVVLLAAACIAILVREKKEVIFTERGRTATVRLVDGTQVHLNVASKLTLLKLSGDGAREVHLEGEAYFNVSHDEERPFVVHTRVGTIRVVGTAFDVDAYAGEEDVKVAVVDGAVSLHPQTVAGRINADSVILRARQRAAMDDQQILEVHHDVDLTSRLGWREGRLIFDDASFDEVVRRLERWYDLRIEADLPRGSVDLLNAEFQNESASEVISIIAVALDLQHEKDGTTVTFDRRPASSTVPELPPSAVEADRAPFTTNRH